MPTPDATPYGPALADDVAEALLHGYALNYGHPGYCGWGFDVAAGHFRYGAVWEGQVTPERTFATRADFVGWLAGQSDSLLQGPESARLGRDAQAVTRQRLLELVRSLSDFTAAQSQLNDSLTQLLTGAGCERGRLRARFPAGTELVSLAGYRPGGQGLLVWPLPPALRQLLRRHIEESTGSLVVLTVEVNLTRPAFHYRYIAAGAQDTAMRQAVAAAGGRAHRRR